MQLTIEKLVFGGQGLARNGGKTYLVWNALPGETVKVKIIKKANDVYESVAEEVLTPSPDRLPSSESHFLSCSPWQILSFEAEKKWKETIASETYERLGGLKDFPAPVLFSNFSKQYGYRNKIEYCFAKSETGISLGFYERGTNVKNAVSPCGLANPSINQTALAVLEWLKEERFPERCLDSLVVRSNNLGHTIAGLFINEALGIKTHPELKFPLIGFQIIHDEKCLLSAGHKALTTSLNGATLKFGLQSFFQINTSLFEKALRDISFYLDPSKQLIDFYSGVGAIGISSKNYFKSAVLVDSHPEAIAYAKENIKLNGLSNCEAVLAQTEDITRLIDPASFIIFDPPRAGLHPKVISKVLSQKPPRIVYLSCDIATCARDIKALSESYKLQDLKLYNFFPRTPHIESLAVLDCNAKGNL